MSGPGSLEPPDPLERSYRRLLRLFPRDWRARREEEVLGVLLEASAPGQQRAARGERTDLLRAAAAAHAASAVGAARRAPGRTAALAVALVGSAVVLAPSAGAHQAGPDALSAGLPAELPGYSYTTEAVSSSPPGPALALYQHGYGVELADFPQAVVVGAGGAVRRLDLAEGRGEGAQGDPGAMLLSPDGTRVAVGRYDAPEADVAVQDLSTGQVLRSRVLGSGAVLPVAWSPDGSRLVALVLAAGHNPYGADGGPPAGTAVVLRADGSPGPDLTGAPELVTAAEWTPDGRHLLVADADGAVWQLGVGDDAGDGAGPDGSAVVPWTLGFPLGAEAWSPDGALMATHGACPFEGSDTIHPEEAGQGISYPSTGVVLVATGASADPAPACLPDGRGWSTFLGWSGPRSVALAVGGDADGAETDPVPMVSVDVDTGVRTRLSGIPTSGNYAVSRLQVPAAALTGSTGRTAAPTTSWDHGRGHVALVLLGVVLLAGGVGLAVAAAAAVGRSVGQRLERSGDGPGAA